MVTPLRSLTPPALPSALVPVALVIEGSLPALRSLGGVETKGITTGASSPLSPIPHPLSALPFPVTATIKSSNPSPKGQGGGQIITLELPDGTRLQARSPVPLPVGASFSLAPPPQAAAEGVPLPPQPLPSNTSAAAGHLLLRATPQANPPGQPAPTPATPLPRSSLPSLQLTAATPLAATLPPIVTYSPTQAVPGPIPLSFTQVLPEATLQALQTQPLTLTLTSPTQRTLKPATPTTPPNGQPLPPLKVTLPYSLNLPIRTEIPLTISENAILTSQNAKNLAQMQLKEPLIAQILPPSSFIPAQAGTSSILAALRLLTPPETPAGTQAARVLPPTPQTPAGTQPVLLSSGQLASLEISPLLRQGSAEQAPLATPLPRSSPPLLPTSLPAGSMLVVNIPTLTGPTQVLQLHTGQPQNLPVPQTQGVTPVAVQTPQGVVQLANVAAGTVLKGTITGQVLSGPNLGQAILTITTPGPLAGQQVALAVPPAANGTPAGLTLVTGTQLTLQVGTGGTATLLETLLPPSAARATTLTSLGGGWESLQQSLSLLQAQNPVAAAAARANLPLLASFLPGFMRLMEAAQDKDPATLLGKDAAALLRGVGSSLSPDLAQLQTLMQRPEEGGWRGVIFPYLENPDANPQQGKFFWRREKEDDPRAARGTRFVAELNLSNLGAVQVDGLVTYPEVWMKIRLQQPQDADFASGLQQLVASLLEGLQLKGGVSVEITPTFPLDPTQEILAQGENPMGVGA